MSHPSHEVMCIDETHAMDDTFAKEPYKRDDILQKRPIFLIDESHPLHVSHSYTSSEDLPIVLGGVCGVDGDGVDGIVE